MAADERATITIDVDVKNLNRLQQVTAALEAMGVASEVNAARFSSLTGAMNQHSRASNSASRNSQKLYERITLLDKASMAFTKQARKLMFGVIAMSAEFALSAIALAGVNAAFVIGKVVMKGYQLAMGGLAATFAAVGVAAMAAAAAFQEFQTAQFAFRYQSDDVTSSLDKSSFALRGLYRDTQLSTYGMKALSGAFAAISKNSKFTGESQNMLKAFSDFAASSGDPTKGLQAAANAVGLIQKQQTGIYKNSKYMSAEAIAAIKQINPALADMAKKSGAGGVSFGNKEKFIEMLLSGELAQKAGVAGAADNIAQTLVGQFKGYLSQTFVELSDVGQRLLNPIKETLDTIFKGLTRTFRRISGDIVSFGQGPFLSTISSLVSKIENFSVHLIRKYLPTTEGFLKKLGNTFTQLKNYFKAVTESLDEMRAGGSIVIKTFGGPILEIFKQIGNNARSLSEIAVQNREKFLKFGEAIEGVIKSFFGMSAAFRNMFTEALPFITLVLQGVAKIVSVIETLFNKFASLGPIAATLGVGVAAGTLMKGKRSAQRKLRYGGGNNSPFYGYNEVNPMDAAKRNLSSQVLGGGGAGQTGGSPLAGAMAAAGTTVSTAMTTAIKPGLSEISSSSSSAASAIRELATAASATGSAIRGGMTGGAVNSSGQMTRRPARKPGQTTAQYRADMVQWYRGVSGENEFSKNAAGPHASRGAFLREKYGSSGTIDRRPISERGMTLGNRTQAQINDRYRAQSESLSSGIQQRQNKLQGMARAKEIAIQRQREAQEGPFKNAFYPTPTGNLPGSVPTRMDRARGGLSRWFSGQTPRRLEGQIDAFKLNAKKGLSSFMLGPGGGLGGAGGAGITGAMPGGGGGGGGMNVVHSGNIAPMTIRGNGALPFLKQKAGRLAFGSGYEGRPIRSEIKNYLGGGAMGTAYQGSLDQQRAQHLAAGGTQETFRPNRKAAAKAGLKNQFSGLGAVTAMGASYAATRLGSDEAQGALQTGSGLMALDPKLGIAAAGLGTAMTAKTRLGGVAAGAVGGAAMGNKIASALPVGPIGQLIGTGLGAVIGSAVGFWAAGRNQKKMVKEAGKQIQNKQLAELAGSAIQGALTGTTALVRNKMKQTGLLAEAFRKATTQEDRAKVLKQYSTGPDAVLTGNTLSNATGKNYQDMQAQLDANVKDQKKLIPLYDSFDKKMRLLQQSTGMTAEEIQKLAMEKNVNLFDSTVKLNDITGKLGVGMVRTAKQMQDAFKDMRIAASGVFDNFAKGKEMKDAIQAAGEALYTGNTSVEAWADYLNKFGDYLDYKNPNAPLANIISTIKAFGSGNLFGQGTQFGVGGVLENRGPTGTALDLGKTYSGDLLKNTSTTVADQLGSMLLASDLQGNNPAALRNMIASRTEGLLNSVNAGNAVGATDEQKTAAAKAEKQLAFIENVIKNPTSFQNLTPEEAQKKLNALYGDGNNIFGGQSTALERIADTTVEVSFDEKSVEQAFLNAVESGFKSMAATPDWWNQAPNWWNWTFNPDTGKFEAPDTRSPRRGLVGDTKTPRALGATMAAHNSMNSMLTGKRSVTSSFRTNNLGSPSSDHAAGRAYDLTGQNLGQYATMTKKSGGFAEFHGAASSRHLHVVPSLGRAGDTSTPVGAMAASGGTTYNGGDISITIVESKDAKATAREVAKEIIAMQKNERRRM
jgi:hypothetical protein